MDKGKARLFFLPIILFLVFCWPPKAQAQFYKYTDKNGTVHFTDRFESIPKEYRNQVKIIKEEVKPQPPDQALPEKEKKTEEQASQTAGAEQRAKEEEARAAQEKETEEKKIKARLGKEKRIEELKKQIEAKEKEIKSLRTTWMVYDRINFNRLTQEIEALKKEAQSILDALTEEDKK